MKSGRLPAFTVLVATVAVSVLAACGRDGDHSVGEKLDATIAGVERQADAASRLVVDGAVEVRQDVRRAAANATEDAADLTLTAKSNAGLARDPELGVMPIEVETHDGKVSLRGTVPDSRARQRAGEIVAAIDGVRAVDNRLTLMSN